MEDMFKEQLDVGDIIIYTTASRYSGLNLGVIKDTDKKQRYILQDGDYKPSISTFHYTSNIMKITEDMLPKCYLESLEEVRRLMEHERNRTIKKAL